MSAVQTFDRQLCAARRDWLVRFEKAQKQEKDSDRKQSLQSAIEHLKQLMAALG